MVDGALFTVGSLCWMESTLCLTCRYVYISLWLFGEGGADAAVVWVIWELCG